MLEKIPLKANFAYRNENNESADSKQKNDKAKFRDHTSTSAWKTLLRNVCPSNFVKREVKKQISSSTTFSKDSQLLKNGVQVSP